MRITLPPAAHYVGADRWILGGFDDCELHAFVDADQHHAVCRLYWIQSKPMCLRAICLVGSKLSPMSARPTGLEKKDFNRHSTIDLAKMGSNMLDLYVEGRSD